MSDIQSDKAPEKVVSAVKLFYLIIGIGFVRLVIMVVRHWDVRTPYFIIISALIIWSVSLFFVYHVGKGKNWARWTMVCIFVVSIPLAILPRISSMSHSPFPGILGLFQVLMYVWAIFLLFQKASNAWFKKK